MLLPVVYMGVIRKCLIVPMIRWTIQFHSMLLPKSNELMAHAYSKLYNIPSTAFVSLPFMVPAVVPIWLILALPTSF